ncbi:MAG TPA: hypothetical protein VEG25_00180 [Burkholderiales bacterium]|nr:hypothetical protein [Burkholderiales bacterium]
MLSAALPVTGPPTLMDNGDDNDEIGILPIDHGVREASHNRSTKRGPHRRTSLRKLADEGDRALDFRRERLAKSGHAGFIK